ncbi:1,4-alpha-glucan branching enzyme [Streptomyces sp. NPDC005438]|uniref:1,4-alpha-glucan branching enzyme n=1 Tax=Streptomyces sp. NPDC005438 TaxID=3156880 RepID=UPI0033A04088
MSAARRPARAAAPSTRATRRNAPTPGAEPLPSPEGGTPSERPRDTSREKASPGAVSRADAAPAAPVVSTADGARRTEGAEEVAHDVVRPAAPLPDGERERLLAGEHHDPHSLLGAHPLDGRLLVRTLRPHARRVTVVAPGLRAELPSEGGGLFAGVLPRAELPSYRLLVEYGSTEHPDRVEVGDPYRFWPSLGEVDLHLISEGRHERLWQALGARPMTHQGEAGTRFTVWAPNARGVRLAGDLNHWDGTALPLRSLGSSGVWELFVPDIGPGDRYKFEVVAADGGHSLRADPMARRSEAPPATASVVHRDDYRWGDAEWLERRAGWTAHDRPMSVYEVHLPSWRPGLGYRELAEQLPAYVRDLGFTHVELMPCAEHPYGPSWGYQITGYYAPTARLGTPDDFRYLVDALHRAGVGVLMDWVPAHFPKDDWALARFDGTPLYEHPDPRRAEHPDWGTLEFDYGRREVRNFLVANALYWCEEFHVDGLRVDAVASMLYLDYSRSEGQWAPNSEGGNENWDAVSLLQEMNATVYRRCPGVVTVAEESTAWDGVTRPTHEPGHHGRGGLGFGLKWNMGWMHDSLVYVGKDPVHRRYHHHDMTFSMVYAYSENYVLPISHDEVVHGKGSLVGKMPGDWWQRRANHRAYLGYMWAHPGKQLLFMGQEFAQGAEWSEAHGPDWWLLDPSYGAEGDHRGVRDLVADLNRAYRDHPALWQRDTDPSGFAWVDADAAEDNVFAFLRHDAEGTPLLAVSNFSPVVRRDYRLGVPESVPGWVESLNTDDPRYGGGGVGNPGPLKPDPLPRHGRPVSLCLTLPPLATVWLTPA